MVRRLAEGDLGLEGRCALGGPLSAGIGDSDLSGDFCFVERLVEVRLSSSSLSSSELTLRGLERDSMGCVGEGERLCDSLGPLFQVLIRLI